jgi:hypothetical protein
VLAPDWQAGRMMAPMPIRHDPATELDVALGLDHLRTLPGVRQGEKRVLYGYSRGGYYAVKIASGAFDARHRDQVGCVVTISGHFQDPNAPEPLQAYGVMPELDRLTQPILMVVAGAEPALRIENNTRAFHSLVDRGHPVEFILLPQARRTFDFREHLDGSNVTAAEATSKRYSMQRVVGGGLPASSSRASLASRSGSRCIRCSRRSHRLQRDDRSDLTPKPGGAPISALSALQGRSAGRQAFPRSRPRRLRPRW